jgi:hypothetical protein
MENHHNWMTMTLTVFQQQTVAVSHDEVYGPSLEDPTLTLLDCILHFSDFFIVGTGEDNQ